MAIATVAKLPGSVAMGIAFCQKPLLRIAVALLGFRLSWDHFVELGLSTGIVILGATAVGVAVGWLLGVRLLKNANIGMLMGAGGGICGASAIVAADSVIGAKEDEVAVSLGVITLLGTIGIFLYPFLQGLIGLADGAYGVWCGATLHETAHSVAAGSATGDVGLDSATITKIGRVALLAPVVIAISFSLNRKRKDSERRVPMLPLFVIAFLLFATWNSLPEGVRLSEQTLGLIQSATLFLLTVGMAGVGLATDLRKIARTGLPVLGVGLLQWIAVAAVGAGLILWLL